MRRVSTFHLLSLAPLLVVTLLGLGACKPERGGEVADGKAADAPDDKPATEAPAKPEPPASEPEPVEPQAEAISALGAGLAAAEVRGCTRDEDCVTSCRVDGDCCPQLCRCTQVYSQEFAQRLEAHQDRCTMLGCGKAKCREPDREFFAVCEAGLCALKSRPLK